MLSSFIARVIETCMKIEIYEKLSLNELQEMFITGKVALLQSSTQELFASPIELLLLRF